MNFRITPHRQLELSQTHVQSHFQRSSSLQAQISSGERIQRPSDDPEGQRTLLNLQRDIARLENGLTSIQYAKSQLNQANVELLDANNLLVQAKSLALEARQATESSQLDVIANELDGYLKTLESIANSQLNGRYLFSGSSNDVQPFTGITDGVPEYHGSQQSGDVVLHNDSDITAFSSGSSVFQFIDEQSNQRTDIFSTIQKLRNDVRNRQTMTSEEFGQRIDNSILSLDQASDHLLKGVGKQSVSLQQLERLGTRTEDLKLEAEKLQSDVQSPDYAESIVKLQEEQYLLQYSLATVTRLFDLSVLNFLS